MKKQLKSTNPNGNRAMLLFLFCFLSIVSYGQGREYIRQQIREQGECRNVAITETNGDIMLYGRNGCARAGCPASLNEAITELNEEREFIDDIQLTEEGRWLILWGDNGMRWNDIPNSLESTLREFNEAGEVITSVTFNDEGDWIVITTDFFTSSDSRINDWLKQGNEEYGQLWAACVTDDAVVAVFSEGYTFLGDIPQSLIDALNRTDLDVYRLKIAGPCWFFADEEGSFQYNM